MALRYTFSYSVIIVAFLPKFTSLVALNKRRGYSVSDRVSITQGLM